MKTTLYSRKSPLAILYAAVTLAAVLTTSVFALDPGLPPGQNFDLSPYKLQTPIADGGGVLEIFQPELATYTSGVFYTGTDGAMLFWCPVNGATTDGTTYPRSELRDLRQWPLSSSQILNATCVVLQAPSNGKTIIGQIHGNISGTEACKLRWTSGAVYAGFKPDLGGTEFQVFIVNAAIGETINYTIQMVNHLITVTVNGVSVNHTLNSTWDADSNYYFKAGTYPQDNVGNSSEGSLVAFYDLNNGGAQSQVEAPTFNPPAGGYASAQLVTISTTTAGASIRYTTDGSTPTSTTGTLYSSPVNISVTTTLKAIAYKSGMVDSPVTTGVYAISSLPAPWQTADIGAVGIAGSANESGGTYTVNGSGAGITGTADQFRYVYQTMSGDGSITARITSQSGTLAAAIAGVMVRETTNANSKFGLAAKTGSGNKNMISRRRTSTGGNVSSTTSTSQTLPNCWVRVTRTGNSIAMAKSTNGTSWTTINTSTITMAVNITVGIVVTSGSNSVLDTDAFDNVTVVP